MDNFSVMDKTKVNLGRTESDTKSFAQQGTSVYKAMNQKKEFSKQAYTLVKQFEKGKSISADEWLAMAKKDKIFFDKNWDAMIEIAKLGYTEKQAKAFDYSWNAMKTISVRAKENAEPVRQKPEQTIERRNTVAPPPPQDDVTRGYPAGLIDKEQEATLPRDALFVLHKLQCGEQPMPEHIFIKLHEKNPEMANLYFKGVTDILSAKSSGMPMTKHQWYMVEQSAKNIEYALRTIHQTKTAEQILGEQKRSFSEQAFKMLQGFEQGKYIAKEGWLNLLKEGGRANFNRYMTPLMEILDATIFNSEFTNAQFKSYEKSLEASNEAIDEWKRAGGEW